MIKRIFKGIGLILLLLILLVGGGLGWFMGTEKGFQQVLALAQRFAPGTLEWEHAEGKLAGALQLRGLQYSQDGGLDASVDSVEFDWSPGALFSRELRLEQLHVDGIELRLAETEAVTEESEPASGLPDITLPLSIQLDDVLITNVAVYPAGQETPIVIDRVALAASAEGSDVQLTQLEVEAPQGELRLTGDVQTRDDYAMDLALDWQADVHPSGPVQGEGVIKGSLAAMQIEHRLSGLAQAELDASVADLMTQPSWDASIKASLPEPERFSELLSGEPTASIETSGNLDDFQAQAAIELTSSETGPVRLDADLAGSMQRLQIQSLVARLSDSGAELAISGEFLPESLEADIEGQWQSLGWPLEGTPQFGSARGQFAVTGTPESFEFNLDADVDGEQLPSGQWRASANGSTTALETFTLEGQTLTGLIKASGEASWQDRPEWDVELVTEGIDPGTQWPEFSGQIDLRVKSQGQVLEQGVQLVADIEQLSGSLREQPLSGSGHVELDGDKLQIEALDLTHGPSSISASGAVDEQIALDFAVNSPDLTTLVPELQGEVDLSGTVSGSRQAPSVKASGTAENIAFGPNGLTALAFSVDAGLSEQFVSTIELSASGITAGGQQISEVNLDGEGTPAEHEVSLSAQTDQGDLVTALAGGYQDASWNGSLSRLQLSDTPAGNWQLRKPAPIDASAEQADLSALCLDNSDELGSICVDGNWQLEGDSQAVVTLSDLSPGLAEAYMPEGFVLDTQLDGELTASLDASGSMNAEAGLALSAGELTIESSGSPVRIGLEQTTVDASWQDEQALVDVVSAFTDFGELNLQASLSDPAGEGALAGRLDLDFDDLTLISAFAPQVQQVAGSLDSNLVLGGTLQAPLIEGELALRDFHAEIPETAMVIEDTQLRVTGERDGSLLIDGESMSGGGQLTIDGSFNPGSRALDLSVNGDSYSVANTGVMQVVVSPALDIAMDDSGMQVVGSVTIPQAYINANGGNEGIKTVSASSDVVYVSEEGEVEEQETAASQVEVDVQIVLGDSVEVEAGDFRGRLEGDLRVQQSPGIAPRGTGTINVTNGDYVIYGQQLNMERGRILFSGGPVDNPSLDMEVAREVQEYDVIAGARIQGTAQSPRLELYSEPSMPDASILSFILLGQPPGTMGGSYTLGKYLTPDLYVSYGIGLFDAINTFNMRYRLTDKLAVEAESGSGSSADIIYTIER